MAYMLLCVLPKDIVEIIYKFKIKNIELKAYAFKYFTKFVVCDYGYIKSDVYPGVYDLDKLYKKHIKIEYIYDHLTYMLESFYLKERQKLQPILNHISKHLMFYYNILLHENSLKRNNTNYKYLKASIELWFKLCQKNNLYLLLVYIKSADKKHCSESANNLSNIRDFAKFIISPIVTLNKISNINEYIEYNMYNCSGLWLHNKNIFLKCSAFDKRIIDILNYNF